jgi:hypothetical protein
MTTAEKVSTANKTNSKVAAAKTKTPAPIKTTTPRKAPAKAVAKKVAPVTSVQASASTAKMKPAKKPKLVRDSFTMPKDEYQAIDALKQRATRLQHTAKKSELLRAGVMALSAMDDKNFMAILAKVPALKTGRPGRV